jgi:uncharacterized protein YhhL (DUF1145 family)
MQSILDFISGIIGVNLSDPHALPFAAPLVVASFFAFLIGFVALMWLEKERVQDERKALESQQRTVNR